MSTNFFMEVEQYFFDNLLVFNLLLLEIFLSIWSVGWHLKIDIANIKYNNMVGVTLYP